MVSLIRPYSSFSSWALVRTVKCTLEKQTPLQVFTGWLCIGKHLHQSAQINILIEYFLTLSLLWPCACHFLIREICQCLFEEFDIFCYFGICPLYCRFCGAEEAELSFIISGPHTSKVRQFRISPPKQETQKRVPWVGSPSKCWAIRCTFHCFHCFLPREELLLEFFFPVASSVLSCGKVDHSCEGMGFLNCLNAPILGYILA